LEPIVVYDLLSAEMGNRDVKVKVKA